MDLLEEHGEINTEDEDGNLDGSSDPADLRKKRAGLERQIVITKSDLRKILRQKQDVELEARRLKKQEERIRADRDALDKKLKKLEDDQRLLEEEIKGCKKKLKVLK